MASAAGLTGPQPSINSADSEAIPEGQLLSLSDSGEAADKEKEADVGLLDQPPLEWFGKLAGDLAGGSQPTKLGKVQQGTTQHCADLPTSTVNCMNQLCFAGPRTLCVKVIQLTAMPRQRERDGRLAEDAEQSSLQCVHGH